ncbi:MAG: hypothetical protein NTW16_05630 [Bacteroidetes bacterium]|nr:hypothetical protein [Bacteroidota bacterium]
MKQSLHRLLFLLLFFIFIHSGKSGYSRSENGSINGVSAARSSCIFFAGKQWSACNPVISDYLSNLVINVKDANPSLNPDDNTSGYLKGPLWNWPQCRNYNGGSPEQPATTIYLGDNGTFGCDSWADVDTKYPKWQVVIHTAANIEAGLYGSWSGYSNVQHKTNTSPRFTSTGTWYWGMKVEYTDAGVTTGWYCNNDVNWSNMYGTPTSNLTVTVSALNNPSSQSAVLNGTNPSSQIDLSWSKDAQNHNVMIVRKLSGASWTEPAQGTTYTVGNSIGSGTVVHNSNGTSLTDDVSSSSTYDYKFYSENWGYYSSGVVTSSLTTNTAATDYFRSKTTGNWSATSSWQSSADNSNWVDATSVPGNTSNTTTIQNGHTITLTGSTDSKLLVINAGGTLNCDSQSLNFPAGASLTNNGTFTSGTGTVTFSGTGAITGTIGFNNVNISGAVNFGIQSIIYGTLKILLGGYVDINAPTYATGSLLLYSAGIPFDRDVEWSQLSGSAYPYNVQISNGTTLNMNVKGKNLERKIAGNLTIDAGSALDMQDMTIGTTDVGVTITGNIVNNGSILFSTTTERLKCTDFTSNSGASVTLSSNYPGDLEVAGNFTDAGTFNPNNRAVFFNGATGDQTITNSVGETFDYVIVDKATSGNVVLASPVTIRQKLTLTNGLIVTTATNILNVTNTLASAITGGSTSSYISGPVLWTLPASLVAGSTYTIPVGKGGVYLPMTVIDPTTGIGVINITAEAFNGDCGGSAGVGLTSLSATEYWSLQSSSINFTNHRISLTRQSAVSPFDRIGRSTTINGSYSSVGGTPSGNSINNSNNTAAGTSQYFVMAKAGPIIISGSVGVDGTYASLTNAAGAFAAINGTAQTGANILITINGDVTTESGTTSLTAGAWTTLTINPSGSRTISGTVADPLINLNGADNVTIDGLNTGGNLLTIANLSTSATAQTSTIRLIADATSNTITNCSILGSATVPLGTPGGNIFISTGFVTGNDNITISNCKIGPAGANLPSKGVFGNGSTVSVARANSNVTINNCEIYDFFLTSGCAGVYALTGNTVWSITNNKIYQAATRTFTAAGTMTGIYFADAGYGNNIQITGNTIGYASSTGTGTLNLTGSGFSGAFQGIYLSAFETATTCNINSNIISDISLTSLAGAFSGIYNATTLVASNTININSNQVKNIGLVTTTGTARGIYAGSATTLNCNSNTIDNLTRDEAGLFYGIQYASPNTITLNGNTVKNLSSTSTSTASASPFYGIYSGNNPTNENIIGNIICNLTSSSTSTALHYIIGLNSNTTTGIKNIQNNNIYNLSEATGSASIYGILLQLGTTSEISGNSVYSLSGGKNIYGISIWNNTVANRIFNNKIYDLSSSNGSATVYGIDLSGGTTNTVFNNLVGDLRAAGVTAAIPVIGIYASSLTTTNNIYYNTVYLNASSSGATFGSTACYASNAGTTTVNLRNNIFVNISTPNGATGYTSAYRRSGISLNPSYAVASNNNLFYAGTPGTYNLIMYDGTNSYQTLAAYKTAVGARRDSVSISENPNWVSTVGSNAAYLHINPAVLNHIESGAVNIATYTTDFDGNIRQGNFGYSGTGTAPDIGADEFETPPCAGAVGGTASGSATFCGSGTPSITAGGYSFGPGSTYQWQYSNNNFGSDIHDFAGQTNPDVLTTGMVSVTKYYRLKVTCSSGLATDYSTVVAITVNPIPTSSASSNTPPVCTGSTLFLTGSTNIGTVFNWTGPNGFTSTNQNPSIPSVTLDAAGVYSFTAIDNGCSSVVSSTTVIVNQSPSTLTISPAIDTLCIGSIQQLVVTGGTNAGVYRFGSATDTTEGNSFTSTLGPNPMQSFYGGSKQQMIFTAAELIAAGIPVGQFTALKVNLANGNDAYPLLNFTVKMGHTSAGSYATGSSWITGLTTVRNTASFSPQTGLNTLRFNTPFTWNGTSNIVVEMSYSNSNLGTNNNTNTATYSATPSASTLFYRALNTSFAVIDAYTSAASYMYNSRTDIAFLDSLPRSVVWTPIQGLYTNPTATTAYTPGTPLSTVYAKPTTTTTYTATSTSTAGCTSSNTSTITVYPLPTAAITSNANICPGCSVQLSVALTGTVPCRHNKRQPIYI